MNCEVAGRKSPDGFSGEVVGVADSSTGAIEAVSTLSPACAVTQIEHVCRTLVESSGWAWMACAMPTTPTSPIKIRHSTLTTIRRLIDFPLMNRRTRAAPFTDKTILSTNGRL